MILDGTPKYGAFEFSDRQLGKFTHSPSGQVAIEELKFFAIKDNSISEKAILSISVENNAPVVESLIFETHWNSPLSELLIAQDSDIETLTFNIETMPETGSLDLVDINTGKIVHTTSNN